MKANRLARNDHAVGNLVPLVLTIIIGFALLFVGNFVTGILHVELDEAITDDTSSNDHQARYMINNTTDNWASSIDIIYVAIIIVVLVTAISAIFLFTRFQI